MSITEMLREIDTSTWNICKCETCQCDNFRLNMIAIEPEHYKWFMTTIEEQQVTIDALSMAHDAMSKELSMHRKHKDKHALIKSNIKLNKKIKQLEKQLDEFYE